MRALLLALAGLVGGGLAGAALALGIMTLADAAGWIDHGADGLSGAAAFMLLAAVLATVGALGGAVWGAIAGSRPRGGL